MIIVTGAAGFIGSNLISGLNAKGYRDLVLADDFSRSDRARNYEGKSYSALVDRWDFHGWLMDHHHQVQMILHLGVRAARSFLDLVNFTFVAMGKEPSISFIDTPEDIRDKYQYFTRAEIGKLRQVGYHHPFTSLEDGVMNYTRNFLFNSLTH